MHRVLSNKLQLGQRSRWGLGERSTDGGKWFHWRQPTPSSPASRKLGVSRLGCSLHFGFQPHFLSACEFVFYILAAHFLRNSTWGLGFLSSRMFVPPARACSFCFFSLFHLSCFFHLSHFLSHTHTYMHTAKTHCGFPHGHSWTASGTAQTSLQLLYKNTCLCSRLLLFFFYRLCVISVA